MSNINWRTIDVDRLDPDSTPNFPIDSLAPSIAPVAAADVQALSSQVKQVLRGGDAQGALRGALENAPYGGDANAKQIHSATVVEILQSIKQADMTPILSQIHTSPGGPELLDVLMKYLYKGMSSSPTAAPRAISPQATGFSQIQARGGGEGGGQAMSVLLSWHEKLVEIAGPGSIMRVMTDRRTV